ncbi:MAG: hypothetical protein FJ149_07495 [Euryarchaeota archaeon]|nr:hypothetical protein [Euryarchaeota archaeon]
MASFRAEADALLAILFELRKNILSYELRSAFLHRLRERSEGMLVEMRSRPDADPHKALVTMLLTAAIGTGEDEFTTPKLEALQGALVVLGATAIGPSDLERVRSAMLWAGLLGRGYSGGKRATVDGKY